MTHHNHESGHVIHPHHFIDQVVNGYCRDPFAFLGMHQLHDGSLVVRTFLPGALYIELVNRDTGKNMGRMELIHEWGLYAIQLRKPAEPFNHRFTVDFGAGPVPMDDAYRTPPILGEMDVYLFSEGRHWRLYDHLGAHPKSLGGVQGTAFAVWAPNAQRVSVIGHFNNWDGRRHSMRLRQECGIWELFIPGVHAGDFYKFEVKGINGDLQPAKSDPFAFACELAPGNASIVQALSSYEWQDGHWMKARKKHNYYNNPMSIYELHLGSWRRKPEEENRSLSYREMADELVPYIKDLGFTHVEFLPLSEFPFEGSWGYQPTGLFAPTCRYGQPDDLRYLIDRLHQEGIGVIMDWVVGHFPTDGHGLGKFDGTALYEHDDPRRGFHPDWNTLVYNFGRKEVSNFLIANALFWIEHFHLDALRVDAVASMLYNDYARKEGEWIPNQYGGKENLEAIDFIRLLNTKVYEDGEGAITIAEESTAWPGVSRAISDGGLGFGFKWNMGWMNDTLEYMHKEPIHRTHHHNHLTFGMLYCFHENFILPLSHDEVVHGKGSLLDQMTGDAWQKFANLRCYYTFMFCYPGKKLLFMGDEFAQGQQWNHLVSLDWHLLERVPFHQGIWRLVQDLNRLYRGLLSLHDLDHDPAGFEWIECNDHHQSVLSWIRRGRDSGDIVIVCNFTPVVRGNFHLGVSKPGVYTEILNSDAEKYSGSNVGNGGLVQTVEVSAHGRQHSLPLTLPPLGGLILIHQRTGENDHDYAEDNSGKTVAQSVARSSLEHGQAPENHGSSHAEAGYPPE